MIDVEKYPSPPASKRPPQATPDRRAADDLFGWPARARLLVDVWPPLHPHQRCVCDRQSGATEGANQRHGRRGVRRQHAVRAHGRYAGAARRHRYRRAPGAGQGQPGGSGASRGNPVQRGGHAAATARCPGGGAEPGPPRSRSLPQRRAGRCGVRAADREHRIPAPRTGGRGAPDTGRAERCRSARARHDAGRQSEGTAGRECAEAGLSGSGAAGHRRAGLGLRREARHPAR